ncbi:hypothetical protein ABPG73_013113 [Tetrahymena malaccensis]
MNLLLQLHLIVINSIIQKYYGSELKINPSAEFLKCSYRELIFNQCPQNIYTKLNQSIFYVDLYYIREGFNFNKLTQQQQEFIVMNEFISYYGRAAIIASISHEFLKIQTLYNADTTSIMAHQPSRYQNFTASTYQTCLGTDFIEPYDPRCRSWYKYAKQHEGYFFYEPYLDAIEGNLEMTLSSRIIYNSEFKSVSSIDYEMNSIIDLFKITQSQNAYSVLFHEFNNTIFYHPLLNASDVISWGDLEFQNITENCQGAQALQSCLIEKQIFVQQLNSTVDFIQTQNYSIKQQINIDGLYQRWSRYGVNLISLVYPINSQITKYPTQSPYSFSIILTARVLIDQSGQLRLFNVLNVNSIRIPHIVEFFLLSGLILVFIVNYGQFQIYQIQYPIELLIIFLQKSLMEQQQYQNPTNFKSEGNDKVKSNLFTKNINTDNSYIFSKNPNHSHINLKEKTLNQDEIQDMSNRLNQSQFKRDLFNESKLLTKQYQQQINLNSSNNLNKSKNRNSLENSFDRSKRFINQQLSDSHLITRSTHPTRIMTNLDILSKIEQIEQKENGQSKILSGLKPLFLEMKIIKKTFQMLEGVINYQMQAYSNDQQDAIKTLFHFSKAKSIFQSLQNQTGLSRCYFNLGIIYLLKNEYEQSIEHFEASIMQSLQLIGLESLDQINENIFLNIQKDQIFIFSQNQNKTQIQDLYLVQNSLYLNPSIKYLMYKSIQTFKTVEKIFFCNLKKTPFQDVFLIFLFQEMIELFIYLKKTSEIDKYFEKANALLDIYSYNLDNNNIQNSRAQDQKYLEQLKTKGIIIELLKTKQKFLSGLIEKQNKNYKQAIEYLTQSLEDGTHFNPLLRQQVIRNLKCLFNELCLQKSIIDEQFDNFDCETPIDLVFVIQLNSISSFLKAEQFLENIKKSNFFKKNDRIQIIFFNQELNVFLPFTKIQSDHHCTNNQTHSNSINTNHDRSCSMLVDILQKTYECSFGLLQLQLIVINGLIEKFNTQHIAGSFTHLHSQIKYFLVNTKASFTICSYRELVFGQCSTNTLKLMNESQYYTDLYFVRQVFKFDLLSQQQQEFILMNDYLSFYSKSVYYQYQLQGLLQLSMIYNSDATSVLTRIPSNFINITDSSYLNCMGPGFLEPYDPRCRPWYQFAQKNEGYFFYMPYIDPISFTLKMTLSSQVKNGLIFQSVNSMDFDMTNLIQLFVNSPNQYSVLFHEYNSTLFYHPQLQDAILQSWQDFEFQNITKECVTNIDLAECSEEKQYFSTQLQQTINFIKSGNYSINYQNNLDQLYQQWSKFGSKKQIFFIKRACQKLNFFQNQFGIPVVEQNHQIQNSAALFIFNYSDSQKTFSSKFSEAQKSKLKQNNLSIFYPHQSKSKNNDSLSVSSPYPFDEDTLNIVDQKQSYFQETDNQLILLQSKENSFSLKKYEINQASKSVKQSFQKILRDSKAQYQNFQSNCQDKKEDLSQSNIYKSQKSSNRLPYQTQMQIIAQEQFQEKDQNSKILDELVPLFLEMKIIKETFQNLESLINYSIDAQTQNSGDIMNSLFHLAKAKSTFQRLQNQNGLSRCYFNLGIIYLLKKDYEVTQEYFLSAIQLNLSILGIDYKKLKQNKLPLSYDIDSEDHLFILRKRILCLAYSLKQQAFEQIYEKQQFFFCFESNNSNRLFNINKIDQDNHQSLQNILMNSIKNFRILENLMKIPSQNTELFQEIQYYFDKTTILIDQLKSKHNKNMQQSQFYSDKKFDQEYEIIEKDLSLSISKEIKNTDKKEINFMVFEIFKAKLIFLHGKLKYFQSNYIQAIEYLVQSLEEGYLSLDQTSKKNIKMKLLIIRLIITVSVPIVVGVAIVLLIFYQSLWSALNTWEDDSVKWIYQTQQQILHNSAYSQQLIETYSFNQLQLHLVVINSIIQKYYDSELRINPNAKFLKCSYRELIFNECPEDVYTKLSQSIFYVDLYYIREGFNFNNLTIQQQEFIVMNEFISYYGRAAILASISQELLKIQTLYNADTTSIMAHQPSRYQNFTASTYQTCLGTDFIEPYDPRCRSWYKYANQHEGYFFYEPYLDAIEGNLEMTLSSRIYYKQEFKSVSSIDYEMNSIIEIFKATQSQNAYSVLFHEFNNTIFYHPLLNASDVISWGDLEFQNITTNCIGEQALEQCNLEKQSFAQQLDQTVNFIQTLNYSIEEQINTQGLYQYWSRYGVNLISLVYPIRSQITKYPTQQPYSFSIILTARVLVDGSDSLRLFNVLNANLIKIPLIVEFIVLSCLIFIFIINYGHFQIYQIQYPIELLILFLQKSLMEQQQYRNPIKEKNETIDKQKSNLYTRQLTGNSPKVNFNFNFSKLNNSQIKNKNVSQDLSYSLNFQNKSKQMFAFQQYDKQSNQLDQSNALLRQMSLNQDEIQENTSKMHQSQFKKDFLNESKVFTQQLNNSNNNYYNRSISKNRDSMNDSIDRSQQGLMNQSINNESYMMTRSTNTTRMTADFNLLQQLDQIQEKENGQSKILSGLKPLFLEMKIIKKTFQMLEGVINYQIQAYSQDEQDSMKTLFHFSRAKSTFQSLQNLTGLSRCYFNLGIIYLLKNEYEQSCEYFEASVMQSLQLIGIDSLDQINENMFVNMLEDQKDQLFIFCKRILSYAHSIKQQSLELAQEEIESKQKKQQQVSNQLNKKSSIKYLMLKSIRLFKVVQKITYNFYQKSPFQDVFLIFLYQEMIEIFIYLKQTHQVDQYFEKANALLDIYVNNIECTNSYSSKAKDKKYLEQIKTKNIIIELLKTKQKFLSGIIEKQNKNYKQALEYFTQSLEEGTHFNPFFRQKVIINLKHLFNEICLQQNLLDEQFDNFGSNTPIDLVYMIQLNSISSYIISESCLENIKKSNFFKKNDRIQIIIFNQELDVLLPYTQINSDHHWQLMLSSIKKIGLSTALGQNQDLKKLDWIQAINQALDHVYDLKEAQLVQLDEIFKLNMKYNNKNKSYKELQKHYQIIKQNDLNQRKKIIILQTSDQQIQNDLIIKKSFINLQKILKLEKPTVLHLKDYQSVIDHKQQDFFQSDFINYQLFFEESKLITKLNKVRNTEILNPEYEFMTILNNY